MSDYNRKTKTRRPGGKTKKGPNKWLLRIYRGVDAAGKRIYHSEVFHGGSKEADDRLIELHNRQKAGQPLKIQPKLFKDFFDEWIDVMDDGQKRREATIEAYRATAKNYTLPAFGKFALTDVTDVAITRLYKDLRKRKLSQSTIHHVHVQLVAMFKMATKDRLILRNPMVDVEAPPRPKPEPKAMKAEEAERFLQAASTGPYGLMFELAFNLGARPCEFLGLMWRDLDMKQGEITIQRSLKRRRKGAGWYVTPPKTYKSKRTIGLPPYFIKRLEEHRRHQLEWKMKAGPLWKEHGFIFTNDGGEPLNERTVRKHHKAICKQAGLPETWSLKSSRHTCASALRAAHVDLKTISERLGHSSVAITADVYQATEKQLQREASETIQELFGIGKK
jgi:integrase